MRNIWLLALIQSLTSTGAIVVVLLGGILGTELAPRPGWATLPVSMTILGLAATTIPAALLMQRIGRKRGFILSALLGAVASLGIAWAVQAHAFVPLCAAIVLLGANLAFAQQYRFAAIEYVTVDRASVAVSVVMLGTLAASIIGPQLALAAAHWFAVDYVGSFAALAIVYVVAALLLSLLPEPPQRALHSNEPARTLSVIARQPSYVVAVTASVAAYAVMSFIMTATPISMHVLDRLSVAQTAWVIQSHFIAMYLPSLASGWLIARLGVNPMTSFGLALMSACVAIAVLGPHHWLHYWWALVLLGLGWNLLFISGTSLLTTAYRPAERFKAQGLNDFAIFGTQALASLAAGPAVLAFGWRAVSLLCVPLLAAAIIGLALLRRRAAASALVS